MAPRNTCLSCQSTHTHTLTHSLSHTPSLPPSRGPPFKLASLRFLRLALLYHACLLSALCLSLLKAQSPALLHALISTRKARSLRMSNMMIPRGLRTTPDDGGGSSKVWELRPCGMVVQVRDANPEMIQAGPLIKVKVSYGRSIHEVCIAAFSTFGDLKKSLTLGTGLEPQQQRLLYRGKEKDNRVYLHDAGVRNKSKIVLIEHPSSQQKRLVESRRDESIAMACRAVADVNEEVDKIAEKVFAAEAAVKSGRRLKESVILEPTELLMCQLLKLDSIEAEGEAKSQRRILVRRVQKYVETLDMLKVQNGTPNSQKTVVTTKWETFDAGLVGVTSAHVQPSGRMLPLTATSSAVGAVADWK